MTYDDAYETLSDALYGFITDLTALPIRFRNASNQRPTEQHMQLYYGSVDEVGWTLSDGELSVDNKPITQKEYEVSVDIACHQGKNTTRTLQKILHQLSSGGGLYLKYFNTDDIGFLRASTINRRDWPLDKIHWEERSVMTIVFSMMVTETDPEEIGWIETVQINPMDIKDAPNNIAVSDTFEITYP